MLSVLICTYNRPQLLTQCLRALLERTVGKPNQVVVVNGGDDEADRVVESFRNQQVDIKLVKTENKNLAASRNVGLPYCAGDIVAMTDDDAEVAPDWLVQIKRAHSKHVDVGAVGGLVINAEPNSLISRIADQVTFPSYSSPRQVRTLPGVNISYKRQVIERLGPQDETLFRGEDVDYNWRLLQLGYKIYFDPAIRVYHHHRPTLRAFLNQQYMYGRAYYLVRRKWQNMYCVYPHSLRRPKDWLKGINFFAAFLYLPPWSAARMSGFDKILALPILYVAGLAWRGGMVRQKMIPRRQA